MNLSRIQKISLTFFLCTLPTAYLIADWRYQANMSAITDKFEREQKLHFSTDKLVSNCERNEEKENNHYGANHQICAQGLQEHDLTSHVMDILAQEKALNETRWYRNFFLSVLMLNLLALLIYKGNAFLTREEARP